MNLEKILNIIGTAFLAVFLMCGALVLTNKLNMWMVGFISLAISAIAFVLMHIIAKRKQVIQYYIPSPPLTHILFRQQRRSARSNRSNGYCCWPGKHRYYRSPGGMRRQQSWQYVTNTYRRSRHCTVSYCRRPRHKGSCREQSGSCWSRQHCQ